MLVLHIISDVLNVDVLVADLNNLPLINLFALLILPFLGGLAGLFLLISSISNMVSIYKGLNRGEPVRAMVFKQIIGGVALLIVAMLSEGFHLPEGGMGRIPEALSQALKKNGGEIFLNSKITKIIVKNGRTCGLEVEKQGPVEADAVISTASGMLTFGSLLNPDNVPADMRRKVQNAPLSHKGLILQLGLSNRIDVHSHSNNILPMMDEQHRVFIPNEDDVQWPVYSVPTVTMRELAPTGGSIVEMFPPINQDMSVDDWNEHKQERIVESAVKALSRIHDINIAVTRVLSPKDFRDSMHLYKGTFYGLSPAADPRSQFPHSPPVPGLYQAGQTTYPGYGVVNAAMSGIFAAEALMKREYM